MKHVAIRIRVPMNIFVLPGPPQGLGTIIFTVFLLKQTKMTQCSTNDTWVVSDSGIVNLHKLRLREALYLLNELKVEFPQKLWSSSRHLSDPEQ